MRAASHRASGIARSGLTERVFFWCIAIPPAGSRELRFGNLDSQWLNILSRYFQQTVTNLFLDEEVHVAGEKAKMDADKAASEAGSAASERGSPPPEERPGIEGGAF